MVRLPILQCSERTVKSMPFTPDSQYPNWRGPVANTRMPVRVREEAVAAVPMRHAPAESARTHADLQEWCRYLGSSIQQRVAAGRCPCAGPSLRPITHPAKSFRHSRSLTRCPIRPEQAHRSERKATDPGSGRCEHIAGPAISRLGPESTTQTPLSGESSGLVAVHRRCLRRRHACIPHAERLPEQQHVSVGTRFRSHRGRDVGQRPRLVEQRLLRSVEAEQHLEPVPCTSRNPVRRTVWTLRTEVNLR